MLNCAHFHIPHWFKFLSVCMCQIHFFHVWFRSHLDFLMILNKTQFFFGLPCSCCAQLICVYTHKQNHHRHKTQIEKLKIENKRQKNNNNKSHWNMDTIIMVHEIQWHFWYSVFTKSVSCFRFFQLIVIHSFFLCTYLSNSNKSQNLAARKLTKTFFLNMKQNGVLYRQSDLRFKLNSHNIYSNECICAVVGWLHFPLFTQKANETKCI